MSNQTTPATQTQPATPTRRHRKTYAARVAARAAKRNQPKHVLAVRAMKRRCAMHANRMTRIYAMDAGDVPAGKVAQS